MSWKTGAWPSASPSLWPARQQWLEVFRVVETLLQLNRASHPRIADLLARAAAIDEVATRRAQSGADGDGEEDADGEGPEPEVEDEVGVEDGVGDDVTESAPEEAA